MEYFKLKHSGEDIDESISKAIKSTSTNSGCVEIFSNISTYADLNKLTTVGFYKVAYYTNGPVISQHVSPLYFIVNLGLDDIVTQTVILAGSGTYVRSYVNKSWEMWKESHHASFIESSGTPSLIVIDDPLLKLYDGCELKVLLTQTLGANAKISFNGSVPFSILNAKKEETLDGALDAGSYLTLVFDEDALVFYMIGSSTAGTSAEDLVFLEKVANHAIKKIDPNTTEHIVIILEETNPFGPSFIKVPMLDTTLFDIIIEIQRLFPKIGVMNSNRLIESTSSGIRESAIVANSMLGTGSEKTISSISSNKTEFHSDLDICTKPAEQLSIFIPNQNTLSDIVITPDRTNWKHTSDSSDAMNRLNPYSGSHTVTGSSKVKVVYEDNIFTMNGYITGYTKTAINLDSADETSPGLHIFPRCKYMILLYDFTDYSNDPEIKKLPKSKIEFTYEDIPSGSGASSIIVEESKYIEHGVFFNSSIVPETNMNHGKLISASVYIPAIPSGKNIKCTQINLFTNNETPSSQYSYNNYKFAIKISKINSDCNYTIPEFGNVGRPVALCDTRVSLNGLPQIHHNRLVPKVSELDTGIKNIWNKLSDIDKTIIDLNGLCLMKEKNPFWEIHYDMETAHSISNWISIPYISSKMDNIPILENKKIYTVDVGMKQTIEKVIIFNIIILNNNYDSLDQMMEAHYTISSKFPFFKKGGKVRSNMIPFITEEEAKLEYSVSSLDEALIKWAHDVTVGGISFEETRPVINKSYRKNCYIKIPLALYNKYAAIGSPTPVEIFEEIFNGDPFRSATAQRYSSVTPKSDFLEFYIETTEPVNISGPPAVSYASIGQYKINNDIRLDSIYASINLSGAQSVFERLPIDSSSWQQNQDCILSAHGLNGTPFDIGEHLTYIKTAYNISVKINTINIATRINNMDLSEWLDVFYPEGSLVLIPIEWVAYPPPDVMDTHTHRDEYKPVTTPPDIYSGSNQLAMHPKLLWFNSGDLAWEEVNNYYLMMPSNENITLYRKDLADGAQSHLCGYVPVDTYNGTEMQLPFVVYKRINKNSIDINYPSK